MKEHKWYLLTYPDGTVSACYTCDPEYFLHCEDCDIVGDLTQGEIERRLNNWFDIRARLTLTEAALSAAGELLSMSTAENNYLSGFSACDICNAPTWGGHEETCEYRITKERYHAACEALNGDETK